jgi:hypothetical protein
LLLLVIVVVLVLLNALMIAGATSCTSEAPSDVRSPDSLPGDVAACVKRKGVPFI